MRNSLRGNFNVPIALFFSIINWIITILAFMFLSRSWPRKARHDYRLYRLFGVRPLITLQICGSTYSL